MASVCWSLQCLTSALTQAAEVVSCLGLPVQSCCQEGGVLQTNITGMHGEHSQCSGHTGFVSAHGVCFPSLHCSGSRLLYRERALCGHAVLVFGSSTKAQTWLGLRLVPSLARAAQAARSLTNALSLGEVRLIPSTVPASVSTRTGRVQLLSGSGELVSSCDPPGGCQPSGISGSLWLETGSLFAVW